MTAARVTVALSAVIPIRLLLDALWWVPGPLGVSLPAWVTGILGVALAVAVGSRWRAALDHPLWGSTLALAGVVGLGALRADTMAGGVTHALHFGIPLLWLLAIGAWWDGRQAPRVWVAVGAAPVGVSGVAWLAGQPAAHVVNGWPRLLGWYSDMHPHAVVMAVLVPGAAALAVTARSRGAAVAWGLLGVGAALCLGATWVRTAMLFAGIATLGVAVARGRLRLAGVAVLLGVGLVVVTPGLRERFADLASVVTSTAPDEGWGALGSWRGRIWAESFEAWVAGGPVDVLLGRGLGDHVGLHKDLEPHSGWLSLLFQLGPAGWIGWHAWMFGAVVGLWRRRSDPDAALAFGVLVAALLTTPLSNDWLPRDTVVWWAWGWAAVALSRPLPGVRPGRQARSVPGSVDAPSAAPASRTG